EGRSEHRRGSLGRADALSSDRISQAIAHRLRFLELRGLGVDTLEALVTSRHRVICVEVVDESGEDGGVAVLSACVHNSDEETRTAVEQRLPVAQARRAAVLPAVGLQRGVAR